MVDGLDGVNDIMGGTKDIKKCPDCGSDCFSWGDDEKDVYWCMVCKDSYLLKDGSA